jgi:hypothetical protein
MNFRYAFVPGLMLTGFLLLQGCLAESASDDSPGPMPDADNTALVVRLNVQNNTGIPLEGLTFRFTSNLSDTVFASQTIAALAPDSARVIERSFTFAPLRWWNLQVLALDTAGAVRARGDVGPFASRGGSTYDSSVVNLASFQESVVEDHPDLQ